MVLPKKAIGPRPDRTLKHYLAYSRLRANSKHGLEFKQQLSIFSIAV